LKYFTIPFIALGLVLSSIIVIEYDCVGEEMFPICCGSPFVYSRKSLGSSMEYFYSIFGLVLNTVVWSIVIVLLRYLYLKLIDAKFFTKSLKYIYRFITVFFILFSFLQLWVTYIGLGRGFDKNSNYWYWNMDKEANIWGVKCVGEIKIFSFFIK
jgi:hypothetical protein